MTACYLVDFLIQMWLDWSLTGAIIKKKFRTACSKTNSKSIMKKSISLLFIIKKLDLVCIKSGNHSISSTDKVKFLGICIDNHSTFKLYANQISTKSSKNIGLSDKLNEFIPADINSNASYYVRCWDLSWSTTLHPITHIFVLQKKVIRLIKSPPYNTHTVQFFKSMNVLKVKDIHYLSMSMRAFNFMGNQGFITHSEFRPYCTRNKDNPILPISN